MRDKTSWMSESERPTWALMRATRKLFLLSSMDFSRRHSWAWPCSSRRRRNSVNMVDVLFFFTCFWLFICLQVCNVPAWGWCWGWVSGGSCPRWSCGWNGLSGRRKLRLSIGSVCTTPSCPAKRGDRQWHRAWVSGRAVSLQRQRATTKKHTAQTADRLQKITSEASLCNLISHKKTLFIRWIRFQQWAHSASHLPLTWKFGPMNDASLKLATFQLQDRKARWRPASFLLEFWSNTSW